MEDRRQVRESLDIEEEDGENYLIKFQKAWAKIPQECVNFSISIDDNTIYYNRMETDEEMTTRIKFEEKRARWAKNYKELSKNYYFVSELGGVVNQHMADLNRKWEDIKVGQGITIDGSLPMPDGRIAIISVSVKAGEQT